MTRLSPETRTKIERLKEEYGITEKQARYVDIDLREPGLPLQTKAAIAGYPPSTSRKGNGSVVKSPNIKRTKEAELAKMAKLEANRQALDANPQQFIESVFLKGVDDPEITANQIKSAENLGKLRGLYVERIEIDPGQSMRGRLFTEIVKVAKVSEETEE